MWSVLVCVRTALAAQAVSNAAAQLGLSEIISTAISGADALARIAESPADIVLVDTASVRPDTVGFTRRVLEFVPAAVVVFFGPEDASIARGAVAAGARGLIRGGEREDLVASVAKALMLLFRANRGGDAGGPQPVPLQRSEPEDPGRDGEAAQAAKDRVGGVAGPAGLPSTTVPGTSGVPGISEIAGTSGTSTTAGAPAAAGASTPAGGPATPVVSAAPGAARTGAEPTAAPVSVGGVRRVALTERELQVLRGMADGKSNAEIGRELFVSEDTVKTHARRLFRKLGARDRAHAVAAAFRAGLVR